MNIQFLNQSTLVNDGWLAMVVEGLQVQVDRDFTPAYGIKAKLAPTRQDNGDTPIYVVDDVPNAPPGAEAWHTLDMLGRPYGIIPVKVVLSLGPFIGPTISHELLELLFDPYLNLDFPVGNKRVSSENCDPVENDEYLVPTSRGPVHVSNFVLPSWFVPGSIGPWDHLGLLKAPLTLTPGGYTQYLVNGKWTQVDAKHIHSRSIRRHRKSLAA